MKGMMKLWRRARAMLESGMRQQVTLGGALYMLAVLLVALAAFASTNNLLFLLLAAMIATLLISNFISRLGLAGLELDFQLPEHVSARRRVSGRVSIYNDKGWIPSFAIHLTGIPETGMSEPIYFPMIPGGATIRENVEVFFSRRGPHKENTFHFSTRFPFGFAERRVQVKLPREVLVYPCIDPQPGFEELLATVEGDMETQFRGRGHDFYRIRPYDATESARHVDWKATAHTGDLQVREFAREQDPLVQIFLDLKVGGDQTAWFETAVDWCAFLAWRIAQAGSRLYFRTQRHDVRLPEDGDIYTILKYLAEVTPVSGSSPAAPYDEHSVQVVISPSPREIVEAGWQGALVVGPETLIAGGDAAGVAGGVGSGRSESAARTGDH